MQQQNWEQLHVESEIGKNVLVIEINVAHEIKIVDFIQQFPKSIDKPIVVALHARRCVERVVLRVRVVLLWVWVWVLVLVLVWVLGRMVCGCDWT